MLDSLPQALLSSTISWSLLKFMVIEWVMLSNHLILCTPLLLLSSIFPSIRVFSSESTFSNGFNLFTLKFVADLIVLFSNCPPEGVKSDVQSNSPEAAF